MLFQKALVTEKEEISFLFCISMLSFLSNTSSMNISYAKSTSASRFILAFFIIALSTTAGCVRAQDAPQKLTLSQMPLIQATTANSVQIVWNTSLPTRAFIQYSRENNFNNAYTLILGETQIRHVAVLLNLEVASVYNYRVGAQGKVLFTGQFQTNKTASQDYQFDVWGDSGSGNDGQKALAAQIDSSNPDFLLHTGDLIYPTGAAEDFNSLFFDIYQKVLSRVPFYGTLGNHDIGTDNGQPFLDAFIFPQNGPIGIMPERNYYVDYANARIAVIDSNQDETTLQNKISPWLEHVMTNSNATWKFAIMHHPAYSSGPHGDTARVQKVLSPVFAKLHIDVVFAGHDHQYERFNPIDGVTYIVTGAGGAGRYPRKTENPQTAFYWNDDWSFTQIQISHENGENILQGKQISTTGAVVDQWELSK
jgi:predicted phosphodiesterase